MLAAQAHPAVAAGAPKPSSRVTAASAYQRKLRAIEYVKLAATAYDRRDYKKVISLCTKATDLAPTYARSYTWLGAAYQKRGNKREAISAYRWVVALSPGTADAARAKRGLRELGAR